MDLSLLVAAAEHAEHTEGVLLGMPTYWFAIIGAIIFLTAFTITVSFSGRGIERPDHLDHGLDADEQAAMKDYKAKVGH